MAGRERNWLTMVGLVVAIAAALGGPGNAGAQGFYAGAGLGVTDIDIGIWGNADQTATYKIFAGYELPKALGVEAGWVSLGGHENNRLGNAQGTLHTQGWTTAVTGRIPISKVFALYGKLGYFFWSTRFDADWSWGPPITSGNRNGGELFWGGGMRFNVKRVAFLGEYERYTTGDLGDHKAFSFAVRYTF
jgi:hypothetical protein